MNEPLSNDAQARLATELKPGETVQWIWRPSPQQVRQPGCFMPGVIILLLFSLSLLNAAEWKWKRIAQIAPITIALLVIAHLLRRKASDSTRRSSSDSAYVITDRRAIVFAAPGMMDVSQTKAQVWSFYPSDLLRRRIDPGKGTDGDIILWEKYWDTSDGQYRRVGFLEIPDVRPVDAMLTTLATSPTTERLSQAAEPEPVTAESVGVDPSYAVGQSPTVPHSGGTAFIFCGVVFLLVAGFLWCLGFNWFGLYDAMIAAGVDTNREIRIGAALLAPAFAWFGVMAIAAGLTRRGRISVRL